MHKTLKDFHVGDILSLTPIGRKRASDAPEFIADFDSGKCKVVMIRAASMDAEAPSGKVLNLACFDWYEVKPRTFNSLVTK